ncbi:MAG: hypothetical protein L0Y79_04890 [Chlorobi bacterium]|nr:hypothetical protein [Chlorobiota bacterium]MCI0716598.1 hypothetical protein [Chlorobiota bacterium]
MAVAKFRRIEQKTTRQKKNHIANPALCKVGNLETLFLSHFRCVDILTFCPFLILAMQGRPAGSHPTAYRCKLREIS